MNKPTKVVVILMITTIIIYTVVGIFRTKEEELTQNNQSGDVINSGDGVDVSGEDQIRISYEISSGENEVILKAISEGSISTTVYQFENDKLITITLSEEITSGDDELVENIYNHMKSDQDMAMVYSSIDRSGDIITAVLKKEYVDSYGEAGKDEIYNELMTSLELSK